MSIDFSNSWNDRSGIFPFERLLAFYRGRIADSTGAATIEQQIRDDARWRAHWDSVTYLDLDRELAEEDAAALSAFRVAEASTFCRDVAETGGDALIPWLTADSAHETQSPPDLTRHVSTCVYCRRMLFQVSARLAHEAAALPADEPLLREWLLERYYREPLNRVSRELQPDVSTALTRALELAARTKDPSSSRPVHAVEERLVEKLRSSVCEPVESSAAALRSVITRGDPLCVIAAGADDDRKPVVTSPGWFTRLPSPPAEFSWKTGDSGPWRIRLWSPDHGELWTTTTSLPSVRVPLQVQEQVPIGEDVYWEVVVATTESKAEPFVRGVFQLLTADEVQDSESRLRAAWTGPPTLEREMKVLGVLFQAGLYDALVRRAGPLCERYPAGAAAFLIRRTLAGVYKAIKQELNGPRQMGDPEGLWANELIAHHLQTAYQAVGIEYNRRE